MSSQGGSEVAARIVDARHRAALTQRGLADVLGVTTRTIQNYEAGKVVPYKHLRRIETLARKPSGWILDGDGGSAELHETIDALQSALERHQRLMQTHLDQLTVQMNRLRAQREASEVRRSRGRR